MRTVTGKERCVDGWAIRPCSATPDARRVSEVKAGRDPAALPAGLVVRSLELVAMVHVPQVKLRMPLLPADYLDRTELLAELDSGRRRCHHPGLCPDRLRQDPVAYRLGDPTGTGADRWVTLDGGDDDPRRLWASVLAALTAHTPLPASTSVQSSFAWSAAEHTEFVAALVEDLHSLPNPIRLILDNVDELTDPEALRGLRILTGSAPRQVHLVLSSRFDPPLGLHRLRLAGRLREVRADRLRFTSAESATLLAKAGLSLTAPQVQRLHRRTAGWAAGLRLAALALTDGTRPRPIPHGLLQRRTLRRRLPHRSDPEPSTSRHAGTPARQSSTTDAISAELAVELSGRHDAGGPARLVRARHVSCCRSSVGNPRPHRLQPTLRTYLFAELRRPEAARPARAFAAASGTGPRGARRAAP